jgi:hypothetical protein
MKLGLRRFRVASMIFLMAMNRMMRWLQMNVDLNVLKGFFVDTIYLWVELLLWARSIDSLLEILLVELKRLNRLWHLSIDFRRLLAMKVHCF